MILTAIILTGIGSYLMRAFFIFALARYQFPPIMLQALEYVAPTVMLEYRDDAASPSPRAQKFRCL